MPTKSYPRLPAQIENALALQPWVARDNTTPAEVQEYRRTINLLRGKFWNGSRLPRNAKRLDKHLRRPLIFGREDNRLSSSDLRRG
jgi:hypothetical protein